MKLIKKSVSETAPGATLILYGSYARGDYRPDSDIDLLVLIDTDTITHNDEIRVKFPLYHIETDIGVIISPLIFSKKVWETRHRITPFYKNVVTEGIIL